MAATGKHCTAGCSHSTYYRSGTRARCRWCAWPINRRRGADKKCRELLNSSSYSSCPLSSAAVRAVRVFTRLVEELAI
jgi:hypothetical protein